MYTINRSKNIRLVDPYLIIICIVDLLKTAVYNENI